jgi:hypothetical protein|tara:strand:- start:6493 stop:6651 length:159 start_codon:yes stop_codon:yes gene_type:complete
MKEYKINNYMLDIDEAWGDADYYHANEVTVVIYKRRPDGKPYRMLIEEKEDV